MEIFKIHKTELYYLEVNSEKTITYVWLEDDRVINTAHMSWIQGDCNKKDSMKMKST